MMFWLCAMMFGGLAVTASAQGTFRPVAAAPTGHPKPNPQFRVVSVDSLDPTHYLRAGDLIPNALVAVGKLERKERLDAKTGRKVDVSELTVTHRMSGQSVVLVLAPP